MHDPTKRVSDMKPTDMKPISPGELLKETGGEQLIQDFNLSMKREHEYAQKLKKQLVDKGYNLRYDFSDLASFLRADEDVVIGGVSSAITKDFIATNILRLYVSQASVHERVQLLRMLCDLFYNNPDNEEETKGIANLVKSMSPKKKEENENGNETK